MLRIVPPAPTVGDARDSADRAIFRATRSLAGSLRWNIAKNDDDLSVAYILKALSCASGLDLSQAKTPRLFALLTHVSDDSGAASVPLKEKYQRKRPFLMQEGATCVARTAALENSPDYPSSHSTLGWTTGLILAELVPDRATEILSRARAYGESRIVCGVHNNSAVEVGRVIAGAVVAALHGSAAFRRDLEAARAEVARLRPAQGRSAECSAELAAVAVSPY